MAGTKAGGAKAAKTNKALFGDDWYKQIGKDSWKNPNRSRKTGFAVMSKEKHIEISKKGGQVKKEDYHIKPEKINTGVSE
jgi:hypothetical protein